jgi:nucleotide-binding universal stress UspA family protein
MSVVVAAIDDSHSKSPVGEVAQALADLLGAEVEAIHVEETDAAPAPIAFSPLLRIRFDRRQDSVATAIASAVKERDALLVVLGSRGLSSSTTPAGHVTMELVQMLDVAVAVVPPQAEPRPINRVLVAVEGDGESHALRRLEVDLGHRPDIDLVALHVFEPDQLPLFGDQPVLETEAWTEEFGRRMLRRTERAVQLEVRVGDAGRSLRETATELDVDLVVIAWHRDLSRGHGRLVRTMLAEADRPVVLFPISDA